MVAQRNNGFHVVYSDEAITDERRLSSELRARVRSACESHAELAEVAPFSAPLRFGDELSFRLAHLRVVYKLDREVREFRVLRLQAVSVPA